MEELKEEIEELFDTKYIKLREIQWIEERIKVLQEQLYSVCEHNWESQPRNCGCDPLEYRCATCHLYKK